MSLLVVIIPPRTLPIFHVEVPLISFHGIDYIPSNRHPWEIHHHDNARVGANIAEHAIVSLAEMVLRNEPILIPGSVPNLGSKLSVKWKYFEALLAGILAVDAFMLGLTFWFARTGGAAYEQLG